MNKRIKIFGEYIINTKIKSSIHTIENEKAFGAGLDFYLSRSISNFNFMFALKDVFYKKWKNGIFEKSKINYIFGISLNSDKFLTVLNINNYNTKIGLEYYLLEDFVLRAGFSESGKYSYGFGLEMDIVDLNYSYFEINDLSEQIDQFSISFNFK